MKFLQGVTGIKLISFFFFLSIFLVAASSVQIYQMSRNEKVTNDVNLATGSANPATKVVDENSDAANPSKGSDSGSCTITKNGQTEKVATGSVSIKEKSDTGVDLNVNCESGSSDSNNSSTVNTNIDVEVNTGN